MVKRIVSLINIVLIAFLGITIYLDNNTSIAQDYFDYPKTNTLAAEEVEAYTHFAANLEEKEDMRYAAALSEMDLNILLKGEIDGRIFDDAPGGTPRSLTHCKAIVYRTLEALPEEHVSKLKHLILRMEEDGNRGLGGSHTIFLRCMDVSDLELAAVLVHEMGHIVDLGVNDGSYFSGKSEFVDGMVPIYNDDLSLNFYRISWKDAETVKEDATDMDFVTGYATTDPFEDFAESYIMYTLQGSRFRMMARSNEALQAKYEFLKTYIFDNKEFTSLVGNARSTDRHYDSTLLSYNITKFMGN
ncbi:hypothetical protein KKG51_03970 [Patescibacteria group bacterium]|nr:hypothetical protein [Patescibacteria group bacterium]